MNILGATLGFPLGGSSVSYVRSSSGGGRWDPIILSIESTDEILVTLTKGGVDFGIYCEGQVLGTGNFADWMSENSAAERDGSILTLSILPNGGWWGESVNIRTYAGDLSSTTIVEAGDGFTAREVTLGDSPIQRVALAKIGTLWMVARDGDGFTRGFADRSTLVGSTMSILPNGGWINTPDTIHFGGVELAEL